MYEKDTDNIPGPTGTKKRWDTQAGRNKLHELKPANGYTYLVCQSRRDEVVLRRCRIGHCRLTHDYLLKPKGDGPPMCATCDEVLTVKHILLDCEDFSTARNSHCVAGNVKGLFSRVSGHLIIDYLREVVVWLSGVHSACHPSPCYSLQNKLDAIVMDNAEDIRLWCEVAVPYTGCLNKLPLECRTAHLEDVIEETKYQMNQIPCGSSGELTVSIGLFILVSVNTFFI